MDASAAGDCGQQRVARAVLGDPGGLACVAGCTLVGGEGVTGRHFGGRGQIRRVNGGRRGDVTDVQFGGLRGWLGGRVGNIEHSTSVDCGSALSRSRFGVGRENGVRYRKPERPEGCFAFSVPDPFSSERLNPNF